MTIRQDLIEALEGRTPSRTPLSIYDHFIGAMSAPEIVQRMQEDAWKRLLDLGLSVVGHCEMIEAIEHGVASVTTERREGTDVYETTCKRTSVGEIRKVTRNGWHLENWIKEPYDYRIVQWIIEHTELQPRYERFAEYEAALGNQGVTVIEGSGAWLHRTPLMKINIDWAGTEQFGLDVAAEVPELFELYAALQKQFIAEQHLIAAGPGRFVKWLENLTISMIGPDRYRDFLMPVYRAGAPILAAGGKRVMVHYDGALSVIADQIAAAPFHIIESLTEPPEGDMEYDRCRAAWPDKVFWANLNVGLYALPPEQLQQAVRDRCQRAGRRGLAFEISEALPANWRTAVPVILEALG